MQRVVSINLNGNAYQLEENGYNALFAYLDATETQLGDRPDRAQTLADLERTVADKCQACLGPHKSVVTSAEIDRIILELGPVPNEFGPAPGQPAADPASPNSTSSSTAGASGPAGAAHRRLYQIREGSMISGVCMGLSEFLHLDVTLIRIVFVIFALVTSGFGVLAYGALMFIVPRANTREEASGGASGGATASGPMPPHHWPWDNGWPWDTHGWPWDRDAAQDWRRTGRAAAREARQAGREARRAARRAYGPGSPWGFFSTIFFIGIAFFWLSIWTRGHFFFGWPYFWGFPHWIGIVFFFMMIRLIFMPFRMARWHSYGYGPYGPYGPYAHPHHAWVSMWNGLAWFMVMIFAVWAAYHYIPEVHEFIRSFQASWSDSGFHV